MRTIVITNNKGGVGKTTIAVHLAGGLALLGYRVALVDTDPQGHVALSFGMKRENGLYQIMTDEDIQFADVLRQVPQERFAPPGFIDNAALFLLPGAKGTAVIPMEQPDVARFKDLLAEMSELLELDFIVIDTGPTVGMFDGSVNLAADYFIYPTACASLSFDGLKQAMSVLGKISANNSKHRQLVDGKRPTEILGIVPNMGRFSTNNHRENITALAAKYPGKVWNPITLRTVWETASDLGQLVYSYAPDGQESKDAWTLVERALAGMQAYEKS